MNVAIRDVEAIRAIRPVDAALYLRAKGWTQQGEAAEKASTWGLKRGRDRFEALLPMDSELRDYSLRMGDLLAVLAAAEGRSQFQVYSDLLTVTADVLHIRVVDPDLADGSMPIEQHAQMAQKARDLVLAAACATTERRPVWHKRKPMQAMDFVRRVRVGQSSRGSYIMNIISRVTPQLSAPQNGQLFETEEPFERQATKMLACSLRALDKASQAAAVTQEMDAFDQAVQDGLNANLCDAVVGLWGDDEVQRNLEFTFSWSPGRPVDSKFVRRVAISSDRVPVIREAGIQMRERSPLEEFELSGPVVKLERREGAATGKVTIIGLVDDRQARVVVELDEPGYQTAIEVHRSGHTVQMSGTLTREGNGYVLKDPTQPEVQPE